MYASVADLRAEGITPETVDDARAAALLAEASEQIDRVTGQFFEPRALTVRASGRGSPSIYPPVPVIRIDELSEGGVPLDVAAVEIVGAPLSPWGEGPRITRLHGCFALGQSNVRIVGIFGATEADGTPTGRTPLAIRRATLLLALRSLPPLAEAGGDERRVVVEERTRDQSVRYAEPSPDRVALTELPEVDALLRPYLRPRHVGGA